VILTILPGKPDDFGDPDLFSIRDSLASALDNLGKQIWRTRFDHLAGLAGAEKNIAADASAPLEQTAFLLQSHANELRSGELIDPPEVREALERAAGALAAGLFLMRAQAAFHHPAAQKAG